MKAIEIRSHGGPEVLRLEDVPAPSPGPGQVLVRNRAIGVNFVDLQHRAGQNYPVTLPLIPGTEAAGVVEAVGAGVSSFRAGDRVGYAGYMGGNYAEATVVPQDKLLPLPDSVGFEAAAAVLLQGMTAHALVHDVSPVNPGDRVLIHAAAGGVGRYLVQMARSRGGLVAGVVSNPQKAEVVRALGADLVIDRSRDDVVEAVDRWTAGEGVRSVFDSVGRDTFEISLRSLGSRGRLVVFGLSSGPVPPFDINRLSGITGDGLRGSLYLTWATLNDWAADVTSLRHRAREVLNGLADGSLRLPDIHRLPLAQAAEAHRLLEDRSFAGKVLLIPEGPL